MLAVSVVICLGEGMVVEIQETTQRLQVNTAAFVENQISDML